MERLASSNGPTGGKILRPSDGSELQSVAFVQCAGSRDENFLEHCSGVCCLGSLKHVHYIRKQYPEAQIFVFYIDIRSPGRLEDFFAEVQKDSKVTFIKGKVAKITSSHTEGSLLVEAEDVLNCRRIRKEVDLVVLATGIVPNQLDIDAQVERDDHGFLLLDKDSGIFPAGCARRPVEVAESVRDATAAALRAIQVTRG
jgi:quinone-modifying oxidoreductase subunit QmoA